MDSATTPKKVRATKQKNIIITSQAARAMHCRGPYDVANLGRLFGFSAAAAKHAISVRPTLTPTLPRTPTLTLRPIVWLLCSCSETCNQCASHAYAYTSTPAPTSARNPIPNPNSTPTLVILPTLAPTGKLRCGCRAWFDS
jgi:hypothetical protein